MDYRKQCPTSIDTTIGNKSMNCTSSCKYLAMRVAPGLFNFEATKKKIQVAITPGSEAKIIACTIIKLSSSFVIHLYMY